MKMNKYLGLLLYAALTSSSVLCFKVGKERKQPEQSSRTQRNAEYRYDYGEYDTDSAYFYHVPEENTQQTTTEAFNDVMSSAQVHKERDAKETTFLDGLLVGYDQRIRPNNKNGPVRANVSIFMNSFYSINEQTMDYKMNIFLRLRWNDPRLAHNLDADAVALHPSLLSKIWIPDVFFSNEKHANFHQVTTENKFLRVYKNGDIYSSVRLTLTLSCAMHLHNFPMDVQVCKMEMESFGFDMKDLIFNWENGKAVQLPESLTLPQFLIRGYRLTKCTKIYSTGSFTCLGAEFILQRQMGYYIIQMYAPSLLIVILSWVAFWINMDAAPARTALGITTVLTMTTQSSGARASLPKVSYVKAIDIWFAVCLIFVFAALLEFAAVNFLSRQGKPFLIPGMKQIRTIKKSIFGNARQRRQRRREVDGTEIQYDEEMRTVTSSNPGMTTDPRYSIIDGHAKQDEKVSSIKTNRSKAKRIDTLSRIFFPIVFLVFNLIYWITYQVARDDTRNILEGAMLYES